MQQYSAYWLVVRDFELYMINGELPFGRAEQLGFTERPPLLLGQYNGFPVFMLSATEADQDKTFVNLRLLLVGDEQRQKLLHQAVSLHHFFANHRYCGKCTSPFQLAKEEIALHCSHCNHRLYPTISPSIIVAVRRGKQILLANHLRHKGTIYTTLAGFLEAGESVEQAVHREVFEETGIKIKNLRYVSSQAWAFPHSLMLAFLADYESGEITLQESELVDAQWFNYDQTLPMLPPEGTIALHLIQQTLKLCEVA